MHKPKNQHHKTAKNKNTGKNQNSGGKKKDKHSTKQKKENFILKKIEYPQYICTKCGKIIEEVSSAVADKETGEPVHFTCVIEFLKKAEILKENEELIYIGNGNFAIIFFENPRVRKRFKIIKMLEWEDKNKTYGWKENIAGLASQV